MRRESLLGIVVVLCVLGVANITSGTIIRGIEMDFVTIGNAGNAADTTFFGAVGYNWTFAKCILLPIIIPKAAV